MTHQVKLGTKPVNGSRGYFLCKCDECGWLGSSEEATGGGELYYCPICSAQEPDEQVGAAQVFNTMLAHINAQAARIAELEQDAARYRTMRDECLSPEGTAVQDSVLAMLMRVEEERGPDSWPTTSEFDTAIDTATPAVEGGAA